jgi:hypothetical protein
MPSPDFAAYSCFRFLLQFCSSSSEFALVFNAVYSASPFGVWSFVCSWPRCVSSHSVVLAFPLVLAQALGAVAALKAIGMLSSS